MPQLDIFSFSAQIFWCIIVFWAMYITVFTHFIFPVAFSLKARAYIVANSGSLASEKSNNSYVGSWNLVTSENLTNSFNLPVSHATSSVVGTFVNNNLYVNDFENIIRSTISTYKKSVDVVNSNSKTFSRFVFLNKLDLKSVNVAKSSKKSR